MPDLSIIIPAAAEEFLAATVADLLAHIEADTEIIAVVDGGLFAGPRLPKHERLRVIDPGERLGQRGAQNLGVKNSAARYVMKLDAHCAVDQGFDRKLLAVMDDNLTIVPAMRNLWVYNWECEHCGQTQYQGPMPKECRSETCEGEPPRFVKKMVWNPKPNPHSTAYRFNKNLQFKYFGEQQQRQGKTGLQDSLSLQGSCFMAAREAYWARELCDETWGSWGQQGSEVALKTWLSGGEVKVLVDTWYAHQFRTKGGDAFPHGSISGSQRHAREVSRDLFLNDKWHGQTRPLVWLLEKFWEPLSIIAKQPKPMLPNPATDDDKKRYADHLDDWENRWQQSDLDGLRARGFQGANLEPRKGLIYYTDCQLDEAIAAPVRERLIAIAREKGLTITTAALGRKLTWGTANVKFHSLTRGPLTMFKQILGALENSTAEVVFFAEHDVLYDASHFDFTPPDRRKVYYNANLWQVRVSDGHAVYWDAHRVSQLCGYRDVLIEHYRKRIAKVERDGFSMALGYEPGTPGRVDDLQAGEWRSSVPNIDLKHGGNLTPAKWALADFRNAPTGWQEAEQVPGWPPLVEVLGGVYA